LLSRPPVVQFQKLSFVDSRRSPVEKSFVDRQLPTSRSSSNLVLYRSAVFNVSKMPLKITPSTKRSSLRQKSYEVDPIRGPKIYPSRGFFEPVRQMTVMIIVFEDSIVRSNITETIYGNTIYLLTRYQMQF
jgi:hypothetical protein